MMVPPVFTFTTVSFGQFNLAIFNAIDGSDVNTIGADHLHMLFYRNFRHLNLLAIVPEGRTLTIRQSNRVCSKGLSRCLLRLRTR
jgi:hypothetical protein